MVNTPCNEHFSNLPLDRVARSQVVSVPAQLVYTEGRWPRLQATGGWQGPVIPACPFLPWVLVAPHTPRSIPLPPPLLAQIELTTVLPSPALLGLPPCPLGLPLCPPPHSSPSAPGLLALAQRKRQRKGTCLHGHCWATTALQVQLSPESSSSSGDGKIRFPCLLHQTVSQAKVSQELLEACRGNTACSWGRGVGGPNLAGRWVCSMAWQP